MGLASGAAAPARNATTATALRYARGKNRATFEEAPCAPFNHTAAPFGQYAACGRFTATCIDKISATSPGAAGTRWQTSPRAAVRHQPLSIQAPPSPTIADTNGRRHG